MNSQHRLILLLAIVGFSATGCMKEFTCVCSDIDNGYYHYTISARTEEAARELCEPPGGACLLQE